MGVALSSIAPFQHTACLLKDIYSPGTLHMRMTRSIVPRGTEMSDSDQKLAVAVAVSHQTEDLCGQFLTTSYVLESLQSSESYISGTIDLVMRMCSVLQLENLASVASETVHYQYYKTVWLTNNSFGL